MKSPERKIYRSNALWSFGLFVFFCMLIMWVGPYNFTYQEHLGTFYFEWRIFVATIELPGGICELAADFLIQFFVWPVAGVAVTAALLTLVTMLLKRLLTVISGTYVCAPLAALPSLSALILHYDINYMYSGTMAMALMIGVTSYMFRRNGTLRFSTDTSRVLYTLVSAVLMYAVAGSVAVLFAAAVVMTTLIKNPRRILPFLFCPVVVVLQGWMSVRGGLVHDMAHALLPQAYYTHGLQAPALMYLPWAAFLAVLFAACVIGRVKMRAGVHRRAIYIALCVVAMAYGIAGVKAYVNPAREQFKYLNHLIRAGRWDEVIAATERMEAGDPYIPNCRNMALAETGALADRLFDISPAGMRSICNSDTTAPYIRMLMSDVHYSMGHNALARRYAFEANSSLNNLSPRLLQRLADESIIYGEYALADKYLAKLEHTLFYRDWAAGRRAVLAGTATDSVLLAKRACLPHTDNFAAYSGIDHDLALVMEASPAHAPTVQYLGALSLLSGDMGRFMQFVGKADSLGVLRPLPRAFAEGIVAAGEGCDAGVRDSLYGRYGIDDATIARYNAYKADPQQNKDNLWYYLEYAR